MGLHNILKNPLTSELVVSISVTTLGDFWQQLFVAHFLSKVAQILSDFVAI